MEGRLKKLRVQPGLHAAIIGAQRGFVVTQALLEAGITHVEDLAQGPYQWLAICVRNRAEVAALVPQAVAALAPDGLLWICYPKQTGRIPTDLTRDHGWESIAAMPLRHINLISIDEDWTGWCVQHGNPAADAARAQRSQARYDLLGQYIDSATREIRYPEAMVAVLAQHPAEQAFFHSLSFTNRKEYLEWIVSARRPETQAQRLAQLPIYLSQGRKNPAGR